MKISIITQPDRKISQSVLYFQFRFMGWTQADLEYQDDKYGRLPFGYVIGYQNERMIGVINLLKRKIKFKQSEILLGGIGGVCTHAKFRHQGIASQLLQQAMKALKKAGCDIVFLCTDLDPSSTLYTRLGFVPLGRPYKATGASGKIYTDNDGLIAPVNSQEIFNQVLQDSQIFDLQGQNW